jgi:5-methyltetrahydropteroyltriglutamate--homocysteine methyltransferase
VSTTRILTTHVGSLIRPPPLVPYLSAILAGKTYDEAAFQDALTMSVAEVVKRQAEIGIDIINDGEFGKTHWYRYVIERFAGIESRPASSNQTYFVGKDRERFREFYSEYDKDIPRAKLEWAVTSAVSYSGISRLQQDIKNLKAALAKVKVESGFLPVVAPASIVPELKDAFYGDEEKFIYALAEALREEYKAITDAGLIVQIDDAWLPAMYERMVPP